MRFDHRPPISDDSRSAALHLLRSFVLLSTLLAAILLILLVAFHASAVPMMLTGVGIMIGLVESISLTLRIRRHQEFDEG